LLLGVGSGKAEAVNAAETEGLLPITGAVTARYGTLPGLGK
jgi:hypothetical protein